MRGPTIHPHTMPNQAEPTLSFWLRTPFRRLYIRHIESAEHKAQRLEVEWRAKGCPVPPPHTIKQQTIRAYAEKHGIKALVETGTFEGDMVAAMLDSFEVIHSIELQSEYYESAMRRFANISKVHLYQGDSAVVIRQVLEAVHQPAVFWLDGHYSGGDTAKADKETPIVEEIEAIAHHPASRDHFILVDDAHCFTGSNDYPTLEGLQAIAAKAGYSTFTVEHNIIRISA